MHDNGTSASRLSRLLRGPVVDGGVPVWGVSGLCVLARFGWGILALGKVHRAWWLFGGSGWALIGSVAGLPGLVASCVFPSHGAGQLV